MYKKKNITTSGKQDLSNYIEGFDVYNAEITELINDPKLNWTTYTITTFEFRPDLIAEEVYGDVKYLGVLFLLCGTSFENYTKGTVLSLLPKEEINKILEKL